MYTREASHRKETTARRGRPAKARSFAPARGSVDANDVSGSDPAILTYVALRRVAKAIAAKADQQLVHWGISLAQYQVLRYLNDNGPATLGELSDYSFGGNSNMTAIMDRMERDGLVERVRDVPDRRVVRARLTHKGQELIEAATQPHRRFIVKLLSGLEPEALAGLRDLLARLESRATDVQVP